MASEKTAVFRLVRIIVLLTILFIVALSQWQVRRQTAKWNQSQWVVIYPVNAENNAETQAYIDTLQVDNFTPVETYLNRQAHRYGITLESPFTIELAPQVEVMPPVVPESRTILSIIWYSLKLRYYSLLNNTYDGPTPDIKIYVKYFAARQDKFLSHSIGLEKGKVGIVNGFSSWKYKNLTNIIIAHEILHTVGATDKYDLATNFPYYPDGYGDPQQDPLLPQSRSEIMGGAIILSESKLRLPSALRETVVGELTAREVNWLAGSKE